MNNKKLIGCVLTLLLLLSGCGQNSNKTLQIKDMKAVSELAVFETYYHNVARFHEEDAEGFLFWQKDKHFWIEYSGYVTVGIDSSKLAFTVNGENVEVTLPKAKILGSGVDAASLTQNSFFEGENTASADADDQTEALKVAQDTMEEEAKKDTFLLSEAEARTEELLTNYINGIGDVTGIEYKIIFTYIEETPAQEQATEDTQEQQQ